MALGLSRAQQDQSLKILPPCFGHMCSQCWGEIMAGGGRTTGRENCPGCYPSSQLNKGSLPQPKNDRLAICNALEVQSLMLLQNWVGGNARLGEVSTGMPSFSWPSCRERLIDWAGLSLLLKGRLCWFFPDQRESLVTPSVSGRQSLGSSFSSFLTLKSRNQWRKGYMTTTDRNRGIVELSTSTCQLSNTFLFYF